MDVEGAETDREGFGVREIYTSLHSKLSFSFQCEPYRLTTLSSSQVPLTVISDAFPVIITLGLSILSTSDGYNMLLLCKI